MADLIVPSPTGRHVGETHTTWLLPVLVNVINIHAQKLIYKLLFQFNKDVHL